MKKIYLKLIITISLLFSSLQLQIHANQSYEVDYFMKSGIRLKDTSYIFYNYSNYVYRYDFKTNTTIESNALHNINRTGSVLIDDIYYVGTNYGFVGYDEFGNDLYQFNIMGFSVDNLNVVYDHDFNFQQKSNQKFAVDKNHNFYFSVNNSIVSYDLNGNMIDKVDCNRPLEVKQIFLDQNILVYDDGYEGKEGSIKVDNGHFVSSLNSYYGKLDSYYKVNDNGQYSIDQYGQLSLMSYEDDNGPNFSSMTLFDVDTSGTNYSMSADFNNQSAYIGDKYGNLYNYDLNSLEVKCNKNIGNKNIVNIYYYDSNIYVFYVRNGTYNMEVYNQTFLEDYYEQKEIYYNEHSTYLHSIDEIKNQYFSLINTVDYENYDIYLNEPNLKNPYYEGAIKDEVIYDLFNQVNFFRWLAGVDEVELYKDGLSTYQKVAVIQYAINKHGLVDQNGIPLDHFPSQPNDMDDEFYNQAYIGSSKANLSFGIIPSNTILHYIIDHTDTLYSNNPIGHRTSILDYQACKTSFGEIIDDKGVYYNATYLSKDNTKVSNNKFTPWPVAGYMPSELINADVYWSITLTQDKANYLTDLGSEIILIHDGIEYNAVDVINQEVNTICFKLPYELINKITKEDGTGNLEFIVGETVTVKANNILNERKDRINITYSTTFINLYDIYPSHIELNTNYVQLKPNETYQFKVEFDPLSTTHQQIKWSSSDSSIASIDSNGFVEAHKSGVVTITAESENGLVATSTLNVVADFSIYLDDLTINIGETIPLNVKVDPEDTTLVGAKNWYTSNPDVVSINMYGEITGKKAGNSSITVMINGMQASCVITVVDKQSDIPVTSINLNKFNLNLEVGESYQLIPTITPNNATNKTLSWEIENPSIASVDQNGNVVGLKEGLTVLKVKTTNHLSATCTINVYKVTRPITSITLNNSSVELNINDSIQLLTTIKPYNTNGSKKLIWTSSDNNIATVDNNGLVHAIGNGVAQITVKTNNGLIATCEIIVKNDLLYGDVNNDGKVNAQDRMMITRYIARWVGYDSINLDAADVNMDGKINAQDRMILTRHVARWSGYDSLPLK